MIMTVLLRMQDHCIISFSMLFHSHIHQTTLLYQMMTQKYFQKWCINQWRHFCIWGSRVKVIVTQSPTLKSGCLFSGLTCMASSLLRCERLDCWEDTGEKTNIFAFYTSWSGFKDTDKSSLIWNIHVCQ